MSSSRSWFARRRPAGEGGFTLLEVIVGLAIVLLVSASLIPVLVTGAVASINARMSTSAKNLTTQRLDAMRSLPYHVAAQNGPFVDVLDEYYANSSATSINITATGGTGSYVASGTVPGQTVASPYYLVSFSSSSSPNPLPSGFTQSVYTQFVAPNTTGGATPTGDKVMTPSTAYNNNNPTATQTDTPISNTIAITVVTSYTIKRALHSYRDFTEISDTGHDSPLVVAETGTDALDVSSTAYDGSAIEGTFGQIGQDATLSNESNALDSVTTANITWVTGATTHPPLVKGQASYTAPPNSTSGLTGSDSAGCIGLLCGSGTACGFGYVGPTNYNDVSATVATAQPRVPYDVESGNGTTFAFPAQGHPPHGNGNAFGTSCLGLGFTNVIGGSPAANSALKGFDGTTSVVQMEDQASGNLITGSAKVDTPLQVTNPVTSSATVTYGAPLFIFPGMSFIPNGQSLPDGKDADQALVAIEFSAPITISCNASQPTATADYAGTIYVWERVNGTPGYQAIPFSYNSGTPTVLPSLSSINAWTGTQQLPLSTYLATWTDGSVVQQAGATNNGVHALPAALSIVTQPTLSDGAGGVNPATSVIAQIGGVSCVSEDYR